MIRNLTLAAMAAALLCPTVHAQQAATSASRSQQTAGVSDPLFASAAAIGGLTEVALSQLGAQKATDPELKEFSQRMIQEHTRMNQELATLASQKQIPVPTAVDPRAQFCVQSLSGLSGEKFDACYAKAQLIVHMDSVAMFEAEAERGQDPDMKALAAKSLPHIQEHLATVKPIAMRYEQQHPSTGHATPKKTQ